MKTGIITLERKIKRIIELEPGRIASDALPVWKTKRSLSHYDLRMQLGKSKKPGLHRSHCRPMTFGRHSQAPPKAAQSADTDPSALHSQAVFRKKIKGKNEKMRQREAGREREREREERKGTREQRSFWPLVL